MVQKVEMIPVICHDCGLSVGERQRINPECAKERSMGYQNCEEFKSKSKSKSKISKKQPTLRTREQLEWLIA